MEWQYGLYRFNDRDETQFLTPLLVFDNFIQYKGSTPPKMIDAES